MRKKILSATFVVAMAAIAGYNTYLAKNKSFIPNVALTNIEALAQSNNNPGEGVEICDIFKYNRNYMEKYELASVQESEDSKLYAELFGKTYSVGKDVKVGDVIGIPICADSPGNCCEKAFIENPIKKY